jgi:hypothetical protein
VYTLYCGIASVPTFYGVREEDATSILDCLADCDLDPDCGAAFLLYEICRYSEQPTSYGASDYSEAVLAVRAAAPVSTTVSSSSSSDVPPIYENPTT